MEFISNQGWKFSERPGCIPDNLYQADYFWQQLYAKWKKTGATSTMLSSCMYYAELPELNPSGVVPISPGIDYEQSHGRDLT